MKNTTQMIEEKPRFFCNCRRVFGFLFLLLFSVFHSQIFQSEGSHIFVQGKAIVFSTDFIQTKTEKGKVYISKGATIYSEGYIANAEFITKPQTLNEKFSHKSQKTTLKKISKIIAKEQNHNPETGKKVNINPISKNENFICFLASIGNGVILPTSSFPKFIISNVEYKTDLNNFSNKNSEQFYHTFTFYNSYRFYIYVRPPPFSFI
jgi:hypothetical protein